MSSFKPSAAPSREGKILRFWGKAKTTSAAPIPSIAQFETRREWAAEAHFVESLRLEQKRAERSGQPFLLMLLEGAQVFGPEGGLRFLAVTAGLMGVIRETDVCGWYRRNRTLGVVFKDINSVEIGPTVEALKAKVQPALRACLKPTDVERIEVSFHLFPEQGMERAAEPQKIPSPRPARGSS